MGYVRFTHAPFYENMHIILIAGLFLPIFRSFGFTS